MPRFIAASADERTLTVTVDYSLRYYSSLWTSRESFILYWFMLMFLFPSLYCIIANCHQEDWLAVERFAFSMLRLRFNAARKWLRQWSSSIFSSNIYNRTWVFMVVLLCQQSGDCYSPLILIPPVVLEKCPALSTLLPTNYKRPSFYRDQMTPYWYLINK